MTIEVAFFATVIRDPEPKTSQSGKPYMRINCRDGDGEQAQWINVTVFGDQVAELAGKVVKGSRVYVEGRLSLDEWTGQDGVKRHGLSVAAWRFELPKIGRNRPPRERGERPSISPRIAETDELNDVLGF
jgi:single-stranded DNA-binding protein